MKKSQVKFETLFKTDGVLENTACLNYSSDPDRMYADSYREAADFLSQNVNSSLQRIDLFVYPVLFLYRHHLELLLKLIIKKGKILLDEKQENTKHHKLNKLWFITKDIIGKIWEDAYDSPSFKLIEQIIHDYVQVDGRGVNFRYSPDYDCHLNHVKNMSLKHLAKNINEASDILYGIETAISYYLEAKYEMRAEQISLI